MANILQEALMKEKIAAIEYIVPNNAPTTVVCIMALHSGNVIVKAVTAIDPDNFDEEDAREVALDKCYAEGMANQIYYMREYE